MMALEHYGECTLNHECSTCGDVAVPVLVLELRGEEALVEDRLGQRAQVAVDFLPDVAAGDVILVHMGVAIGRARAGA